MQAKDGWFGPTTNSRNTLPIVYTETMTGRCRLTVRMIISLSTLSTPIKELPKTSKAKMSIIRVLLNPAYLTSVLGAAAPRLRLADE